MGDSRGFGPRKWKHWQVIQPEEDLLVEVPAMAAVICLVLTLVVVAFQFALALGAPWGSYAMGGAFPGRFPPAMRLAAVAQAILLGLMAAVVLVASSLTVALA
jgi:hypothetical protein